MWYAVTAKPVNLKGKEKKKEFYHGDVEIIINAETQVKLEIKLKETLNKYPRETAKYIRAGIKFIEADNIVEAKRKAKSISIYFDHRGQYHLF